MHATYPGGGVNIPGVTTLADSGVRIFGHERIQAFRLDSVTQHRTTTDTCLQRTRSIVAMHESHYVKRRDPSTRRRVRTSVRRPLACGEGPGTTVVSSAARCGRPFARGWVGSLPAGIHSCREAATGATPRTGGDCDKHSTTGQVFDRKTGGRSRPLPPARTAPRPLGAPVETTGGPCRIRASAGGKSRCDQGEMS